MNNMSFDFIPYNIFTSKLKTNYLDIKLRVPPIFVVLWTIISIGAIIIFSGIRQVYLFCIAIIQLCAIIGFVFSFPKSGFLFERHWEQKYCNKSTKILPIKLKSLNGSVPLKINPKDPYIFYMKN